MKGSRLIGQIVMWGLVGCLTVPVSALAATQQIPKANGQDLPRQVRSTANKIIPAVVSIASTVMVRDHAFSDEALPFGLFKEPPTCRQYGQGSGVIVSPDGYIVTNNHVVADAVDVEVILADRRQYKGKVVATDSKTDVAVVKIQAMNLPAAVWGDPRNLAVGDFVLTIGNPLGLLDSSGTRLLFVRHCVNSAYGEKQVFPRFGRREAAHSINRGLEDPYSRRPLIGLMCTGGSTDRYASSKFARFSF